MSSVSDRNQNSVHLYFDALVENDPDKVAELFAEDGLHVNPRDSDLFPGGAYGRDSVWVHWQSLFPKFDGMFFLIHELRATDREDKIFVRYSARSRLSGNVSWHESQYESTFTFNEAGEITLLC